MENLFRNRMDHGGPEVSTIWVGSIDGDGFYVEEDGEGISVQDREKVFNSGYTTTEAGTGFGLPIVKAVVEAHGWEIDVTDGRCPIRDHWPRLAVSCPQVSWVGS